MSPERVVREALALLDDKGVDGVSLRAVAERLGVRLNTVLWHVKTKNRLLELMADAITAETSVEDLPGDWHERARELAHRYRAAMLAHRDGALVVSGRYEAGRGTLRFADALVGALLEGGFDERRAAWTLWNVSYLAIGLTQEEQALPDGVTFPRDLSAEDFPMLARVGSHMDPVVFAERFDHGLGLLLAPEARE